MYIVCILAIKSLGNWAGKIWVQDFYHNCMALGKFLFFNWDIIDIYEDIS